MQKLDDMIIFTRVVERGSFIAAARQLGLPPTTVSRKVQDLEARLGVELLRRTTRRVVVTDAGQAIYDRASRGLALIDEAEQFAKRQHDKPTGVLRILAPYSMGILTINPVLADYQNLHPDVQVHLTLNNEPLDLVEHGFDLALRFGALKDSAYIARRLYHGPRRVFAAPTYVRTAPTIARIADLAAHAYFAVNAEQRMARTYTFVRDGDREAIELDARLASNEGSVILQHVLKGGGFSILSDALSQPFVASGDLVAVLPEWHLADDLEVSVIFGRHATGDPKIRLFIDHLLRVGRPPQAVPQRQRA